ncbi:alpha/beta hydrolase [Alloalcanivorax gelatiniphagus]
MDTSRPESPSHPTLVCVPGLGLEAAEWRTTTRELGRRTPVDQVVVSTFPGYGERPRRGEDLRPATLGARLAAGLRAGTVLVGHSASSQVVAHAAALAPERVSGLVLVGPTTDPRAGSWPRLAARWLRTAGWERPAQVPFLVRSYSRVGLRGMARAMEVARHEDVRVELGAVRCPVLVVRGRHDRICPEDWAADLAGCAPPGSRALTLPRGAHMVPITHGGLLAETLATWLDSSPVRGA